MAGVGIIEEFTLWVPDQATIVPRDLISEQLLQHPALVQMWAAWAKGATREKHHSGSSWSLTGIC